MATTLRQTYSCIVRRKFLKEVITFVILSTMGPTSCLSWSIVMGLPIMEVRQVCRVTRLVATWKFAKLAFNFWLVLKYFGNTWEILRNIEKYSPLGGAQPWPRRSKLFPSSTCRWWPGRRRWWAPAARATCWSAAACESRWESRRRMEASSSSWPTSRQFCLQSDTTSVAGQMCFDPTDLRHPEKKFVE